MNMTAQEAIKILWEHEMEIADSVEDKRVLYAIEEGIAALKAEAERVE